MYEARQNKEKVSRRIDNAGGMARQRRKMNNSYSENLSYGTNIIQKTVTPKKENISGNISENFVDEITRDLKIIENNVNKNSKDGDSVLNDICGDKEDLKSTLLRKKSTTSCQSCYGVSKDGNNNIFVEKGLGIAADVKYNRRSGMKNMNESINKIIQIPNRNDGVHSEVYHSHFTNPNIIWTTTDNCFFCSGYVVSKGIEHQQMKRSYVFPQIWTYPEKWTIRKNTSKPIWEISNPTGGESGKYDLESQPRSI